MKYRFLPATFSAVLSLAGILMLFGCGTSSPAVSPTAAAFESAAFMKPLALDGGSLAYPLAGGYSAIFQYSANNAGPETSVGLVTTTKPVANVPGGVAPPGIFLVAFTFTLNQSVTFSQWQRNPTTVSIPVAAAARKGQYAIYGYDETLGMGIGSNPGSMNGTSITFSPGFGPVTLDAHTYLFLLTVR